MKKDYSKNKTEKNISGFTLAEVLMVLAIIGIISAMIIPSLITNVTKSSITPKLKEAYSVLNQTIKMSEADNGSWDTWEYTFPKDKPPTVYYSEIFAKRYITPYLKIRKTCGLYSSTTNRCFASPNGGWYSLIGNEIGGGGGYSPYNSYKFVLENGMSVAVMSMANTMSWIYFYVDIDGPDKGYSRLGKDVFLFSLNVNNCKKDYMYLHDVPSKNYPLTGGGAVFYCGSRMFQDSRAWLVNQGNGGACNKNANDGGTNPSGGSCAALIMKDGWTIADDYPWETANKKPSGL